MFWFNRVGGFILLLLTLSNAFGIPGLTQSEPKIYRAKVLSESLESYTEQTGVLIQVLQIEITNGPQRSRKETINSSIFSINESNRIKKGEQIYVNISTTNTVFFSDRYRLNKLMLIIIVFFALVVIFSGIRGLWSIMGLITSILVISLYIIPNIIDGSDPFLISILGVLMAAFLTFYLAHGFNRRTTIALFGTLITLVIAALAAWLATRFLGISGNYSEETSFLTATLENPINLRGLFLAGIMISTLGVLDDITTAQVAAVENLKKTNINIKFSELYKKSFDIGKEHIVGLVNTLAFAYLGGSLVTILGYFSFKTVPWWFFINSEFIISEIVQSVVGSGALVLAVPITTWLAAKHYTKLNQKELNKLSVIKHTHTH